MLGGLIGVERSNIAERSDLAIGLNGSRQVHNLGPADPCDYLSNRQHVKPLPLGNMAHDLPYRATIPTDTCSVLGSHRSNGLEVGCEHGCVQVRERNIPLRWRLSGNSDHLRVEDFSLHGQGSPWLLQA